VNSVISYPLNGADRFQLYFDDLARKNTGTGNVIRAAVAIEGMVLEPEIRKLIESNECLRFLSSISLSRNFLSGLYSFRNNGSSKSFPVNIHRNTYMEALPSVISKDCDLSNGSPVRVDVMFDENKTYLVISVSHVLIDHSGMEILLSSFTEENNFGKISAPAQKKSFFSKLADSFSATIFVSSMSGRAMKRLNRKSGKGNVRFNLVEMTVDETGRIKDHMMKLNASMLSFFLGSSLFTSGSIPDLFTGKNYFVPVPMDRRPASCKNSLLSNFISFIYFKATDSDLKSLKASVELITRQTISQARKNIPGKFSSLLDLFRFVPKPFYRAFIELPGGGHAATFAFSLLTNSGMEGKKILGYKVINVTHYAPVISPPGLNVIFSEFNGKLKILCSFDESRITNEDVVIFLEALKLNLLG